MDKRRHHRSRPEHEFTHEPCDRFTWEQFIRRVELGESMKGLCWVLATYASEDGGDVIAGERLIADVLGCKERSIRERLAKLRALGLIEALTVATPGHPVEYQLTTPSPDHEPIPMRLDKDGNRLTERPEGRAGTRRPVKNPGSGRPGQRPKTPEEQAEGGTREPVEGSVTGTREPVDNPDTGTPVPVNNPDAGSRVPVNNAKGGTRVPLILLGHRHPGTGDQGNTGTRVHDDRHPGAARPAPGCHQPLQDQPTPNPGFSTHFTLTSARRDSETAQDRIGGAVESAPPPNDIEYASACKALRTADPVARDHALTAAREDLLAEGSPVERRRLTVRAAALLLAASAA